MAQIDAVFSAALERPAEERAVYVGTAAADAEMREEVLRLLEYVDEVDDPATVDPLDTAVREASSSLDVVGLLRGNLARGLAEAMAERPPTPGQRVGVYRLIREIGSGGMGVVYVAERADGAFEQKVALKLLPAGTFRADHVLRFERERQILARLNHPHIARLLDGGVDDRGRPFIAMELVDGLPIAEHCDRFGLGLEDRLRLVVDAARGVQEAHRNLVVHCDLKPANILVTDDGYAKLLDFGVAKLLGPGHDSRPLSVRPMTPIYASPESIMGGSITTAADVYQLGLIAYELLCGRRARQARSASLADLARQLVETDPLPPSEALMDTDGSVLLETGPPEIIASRRGLRVQALRRQLEGDLDAIVMRALARRPEDRYRSAEELATDLERYLEGRPVLARSSTWLYRAGKALRRHPLPIALAALLVVLLFAFAHQAEVARDQRDLAERQAASAAALAAQTREVSDFLVSILASGSADAIRDDLTVVEMVEQGTRRVETELPESSSARAELEEVLGRVFHRVGRFDEAVELLEAAVGRRRALGEGGAALATSILHLSSVHTDLGNLERAKELTREALTLQRRTLPRGDQQIADSLSYLSYVHGMLGEMEAAIRLRTESLAIRRDAAGTNSLSVAQGMNDLCVGYRDVGRYDEALELCRSALEVRRLRLGEDHPRLIGSRTNLAIVELETGQLEAADQHLAAALDLARRTLPERHPLAGSAYMILARLRWRQGDPHGSLDAVRRSRDIYEHIFEPEHRQFGYLDVLEGRADVAVGNTLRGEATVRRGVELLRRLHGDDQHLVLYGQVVLADALLAQGRLDEAVEILRRTEAKLAEGRTDEQIWLREARALLAAADPSWSQPAKDGPPPKDDPRAEPTPFGAGSDS